MQEDYGTLQQEKINRKSSAELMENRQKKIIKIIKIPFDASFQDVCQNIKWQKKVKFTIIDPTMSIKVKTNHDKMRIRNENELCVEKREKNKWKKRKF